ncbi:MAG: hypothetical protein L6R41_002800 [Letrouitia leprolyta]|nr:MAG: hypothetical protein L6R41_002800 [Letrouitia leprolyta]
MPILEANSEAFLAYFHSLQKGKGTVFHKLPRSAPYQPMEDESRDVQAKTPDDVAVTGPSKAESEEPEDPDEQTPKADIVVNHSSTSVNEGSTDKGSHETMVEDKLKHHANESEHLSPVEEEPAAHGRTSNSVTSTNAQQASSHHSDLQVTTRSMTITGNTTQTVTEASAATEVPATTSRMPSPAPSLPPAVEEFRKPTKLLSDGAAFLQALPNAAKAFQPRMRGGHNSEASPPPSATSSNHFPSNHEDEKSEDGGQAAQSSPTKINGQIEDLLTGSPQPLTKSKQQPSQHSNNSHTAEVNHHTSTFTVNEHPSYNPWAASQHRSPDSTNPYPVKPWNPDAYGPVDHATDSNTNARAAQPVHVFRSKVKTKGRAKALKSQRYTAEELVQIGKEAKKGMFDRLVEMEGKGKVRVGIVEVG